ncbi:MAG: hypothetical protein QMD12_02025 [Candidatus Aenigmarchaeota archaeon]|nr:hypothetical protein [Candidatus Aenigmarchaeota archaeon]
MRVLTELEKTVLLTFLVLAKKQTSKFQSEESIVLKFPMRQRKNVRKAIKKLEKGGFLIKHATQESYKFSEKGLKNALRLLYEGAKLWAYLR